MEEDEGPGDSLDERVERLEALLADIQAAIAELTTLLPKATGPTAGLPGRLADALHGIDDRLAAVERMGREQFELDQRLTLIDETLANLTGPMKELAPQLKHLGELTAWLGRIEERLHAIGVQSDEENRLPATVDRLVDSVSILLESATETSTKLTRLERARAGEIDDPLADVNRRLDDVLARLDTIAERQEREPEVGVVDIIRNERKRWGRHP